MNISTKSALLLILLTACSGSKHVVNETAALPVAEVVARTLDAQPAVNTMMTAKCTYDVTFGSKSIAMGGSIKMQRDRLIQLSVTMLGLMEVVRIEFTPDNVTIIDRINKRYIEGTYEQVDFARANNLDFNVAQALFWGQLFVPGQTQPLPSSFALTGTGDTGVLTARSEDLSVNFVTTLSTGIIRQTNITRTRGKGPSVNMQYTARQKGGLPTQFTLSTEGLDTPMQLAFSLSGIKTDTGADLQPTVIDKSAYQAVSPETAITSILGM